MELSPEVIFSFKEALRYASAFPTEYCQQHASCPCPESSANMIYMFFTGALPYATCSTWELCQSASWCTQNSANMLHVLHWSSAICYMFCQSASCSSMYRNICQYSKKQDIHRSSASMFPVLLLNLYQYVTDSPIGVLPMIQKFFTRVLPYSARVHVLQYMHGSSASLLLVQKPLPKQYETRYPQKLCQYVSFSH